MVALHSLKYTQFAHRQHTFLYTVYCFAAASSLFFYKNCHCQLSSSFVVHLQLSWSSLSSSKLSSLSFRTKKKLIFFFSVIHICSFLSFTITMDYYVWNNALKVLNSHQIFYCYFIHSLYKHLKNFTFFFYFFFLVPLIILYILR